MDTPIESSSDNTKLLTQNQSMKDIKSDKSTGEPERFNQKIK